MKQSLLKYIKTLFTLVGVTLAFSLTNYLCKIATNGFAVVKITHDLPKNKLYDPPKFSREEMEELHTILSQPFHYLSCGGQSFVFISEDGKHVLKLFKFNHVRLPFWLKYSPPIKFLKKKQLLIKNDKEFRLQRMLTSIIISFTSFKEETGLIYHHLKKTSDLNQNLIFFDKLGNKYSLNADNYAFIIQKTGIPASLYLKNLIEEHHLEEAHKKLQELITFTISRAKKGIHDHDFKFRSNLGFIDGKPAQLDLGSLVLTSSEKEAEVYIKEIEIAAGKFKRWLKKQCPILIESLDQQMDLLNEQNGY